MVTCNGTIIVASTRPNSGFLKRNSSRAKAYPARPAVIIWPTAINAVTRVEFSARSQTSIWSKTPR